MADFEGNAFLLFMALTSKDVKIEDHLTSPCLQSNNSVILGLFRKIMREKNLSSCVFTSIHNVAYYSNFVYCAFGRPYGLVVPLEGEPTTVSALIDGGQPWRRCYGDNVVYTDWRRDNFVRAVSDLVKKSALGNVGIEFDHLNLQMHE